MTAKFATNEGLTKLLESLARDRQLYGPAEVGEEFRMKPVTPDEVCLGPARTVEPLKSFFFPVRETLGDIFARGSEPTVTPRAIVGVKACDLRSLRVLDYVFLEGDYEDPYYWAHRDSTFLVSADCSTAKDVCFCTHLGAKPYSEEGFDLNISEVEGGFVIEAGSEAGSEFLSREGGTLPDVAEAHLKDRDARRSEVFEQVTRQVQDAGLGRSESARDNYRKAVSAPLWEKHAEACVECGACNFICPTCHCFLLLDLESKGQFQRFKNWDSCQYGSFVRVAGGATPRPRRADRLRNRFEKKFDFFVDRIDSYACVGCGRCIEACAGNIDIREVLGDLANA